MFSTRFTTCNSDRSQLLGRFILLTLALVAVSSTPRLAHAGKRKPVLVQISIRTPRGGLAAPGEVFYRMVGRGFDTGFLPYIAGQANHAVRPGSYTIYVDGRGVYANQTIRKQVKNQPNAHNVFPVPIRLRYRR